MPLWGIYFLWFCENLDYFLGSDIHSDAVIVEKLELSLLPLVTICCSFNNARKETISPRNRKPHVYRKPFPSHRVRRSLSHKLLLAVHFPLFFVLVSRVLEQKPVSAFSFQLPLSWRNTAKKWKGRVTLTPRCCHPKDTDLCSRFCATKASLPPSGREGLLEVELVGGSTGEGIVESKGLRKDKRENGKGKERTVRGAEGKYLSIIFSSRLFLFWNTRTILRRKQYVLKQW